MNDLLTISNGQPTASSRDIAGHFGKGHNHVLRDIDALKGDVSNFGQMFFDTEIPDSYGRPQRAYLMNRDGFTLLAMGFTGKEALAWKMKYINAFNAMEQELRSQQQGLTEADFSALSYEARAIIKMELQQKQQAKQIAELTTQQQETRTMVNQTLSAITRPSTSDAEDWKEDINHTIRQMCEEYGLNYHTTIGEMYAELEKLGSVNLSVRQKNLQARMRRGGATVAECRRISKLHVISQEKKLRWFYEGIVRAYRAQLAASRMH
jgi:Rha family phage regulatory protein|nr:MAG TPA: regulatory protein [Caudoviricetes sp.]